MKSTRIFLILCLAILLAACDTSTGDRIIGSGKVITETRTVGNFTRLDLSSFSNVNLAQGQPLAVSVEGEDNILPLIETKVSGSTLTISAKTNASFRTTRDLIVHITVPELNGIQIKGSGNVEIDGLTSTSLELGIAGSGNIQIHSLQADSLAASIDGSGGITISSGKCASQTFRSNGSGNYQAAGLESDKVTATLNGSGNGTVWVTDSLSASLSGSGNLQYYGTPGLDQSASGSGRVVKLGDHP